MLTRTGVPRSFSRSCENVAASIVGSSSTELGIVGGAVASSPVHPDRRISVSETTAATAGTGRVMQAW
jgi:hypothetical protein